MILQRGDRVLRRRVPDVLGLVLRTWTDPDGTVRARVWWDSHTHSTTRVERLCRPGVDLPWPYDPLSIPF